MKVFVTVVFMVMLSSCMTTDSRKPLVDVIHVRGEVKRPGTYALVNGMMATDAITTAGSYTSLAAGIQVLRDGKRILRHRGLLWSDHPEMWDISLQKEDIVIAE